MTTKKNREQIRVALSNALTQTHTSTRHNPLFDVTDTSENTQADTQGTTEDTTESTT